MMEKAHPQHFGQVLLELQKYRESALTLVCRMQQPSQITDFFNNSTPPLGTDTMPSSYHKASKGRSTTTEKVSIRIKAHGPYYHQIMEIIARRVRSANAHPNALVQLFQSPIPPQEPWI